MSQHTHHNEDAAFPSGLLRDDGMTDVPLHRGLSMRDYFAAKAMPALMADSGWRTDHMEATARISYQMADAMLKERNK